MSESAADRIRDEILEQWETNGYHWQRNEDEFELQPVIIFPGLTVQDGWTNEKPPSDCVSMYLEALAQAVAFLNRAQIAHMDLRPPNIMWRQNSDGMLEVMVIDFEDAVAFGRFISPSWYKAL